MAKVSILIPVYNAEKFLEKCIKSALNQTFKDIEIIIINDGSIDSSPEIIKKYSADERIKVIDKNNSGYGESLNIAIKEAKGEYISILEADDFLDENFIKKLYSKKGYDIVKSGFCFYPEKKQYKLNLEGVYTIDDMPEMLNIKPSVWSCMYKKEFLLDNNIFFTQSKGASYQDVSFQVKTFYSADKICFIDEPLYSYRTNNEQSSVKSKTNPSAIIKEFNLIDEFLKDKIILPETLAQLILFELRAYIWNFKRISKNYEEEFINTASNKLKNADIKMFYTSNAIQLKEKIKLWLLVNHAQIFKFFLSIIKKYAK